ncbi:MAG: patatin-like phospholipase family protein [Kofleriaceae bacterium]
MTLGDWLAERPFALAMSSGFFSFFAHTGMLDALTTSGLRPQLVAGSSAGALVGAAYASGLEAAQLAERLVALERRDFWDPRWGAGLLAGHKFDRILRELMPVHDAAGCRIPIKISVYDILRRRTRVIDHGDLPVAVRASCAVPGMFHPVWMSSPAEPGGATAKRRAYWDGGILDRPGLAGVPEGERVLFHHIAAPAPWSVKGPPIPRRTNMATLVLDALPRANPWRLEAGREALARARETVKRALELPIHDGVVRLAVR